MTQDTAELKHYICFTEMDADTEQVNEFSFSHSRHSYRRSAQRGMQNKLQLALQFGEDIYKQGLIYYVLGEHNIPEGLQRDKDKLKNTVVIVSGDSDQVVTCYRSSKPFKNIKTKSKRLYKSRSAA